MKKMILKIKYIFLFLFIISCGLEIENNQDLPNELFWGNIDLDKNGIFENYTTSIKSQICDHCYIYAALGTLEIQYQIDHKENVNLDLSESNIRNCLNISCDKAGDAKFIFDYIRKNGVTLEFYSNKDETTCVNCNNDKIIPFFSFSEIKLVVLSNDSYEEKQRKLILALQKGPVTLGITQWYGFKRNLEDNILYCEKQEKNSSHQVVLIGYREQGNIFIIKNSHNDRDFYLIDFESGKECGFASNAYQIEKNSTFLSWDIGKNICK